MRVLITWSIVLALDLWGYGIIFRVDDDPVWYHFRDLAADTLQQRDGRTGRYFNPPSPGEPGNPHGSTYHVAILSIDTSENRSGRTMQVAHLNTSTGEATVTVEPRPTPETIRFYNGAKRWQTKPELTYANPDEPRKPGITVSFGTPSQDRPRRHLPAPGDAEAVEDWGWSGELDEGGGK